MKERHTTNGIRRAAPPDNERNAPTQFVCAGVFSFRSTLASRGVHTPLLRKVTSASGTMQPARPKTVCSSRVIYISRHARTTNKKHCGAWTTPAGYDDDDYDDGDVRHVLISERRTVVDRPGAFFCGAAGEVKNA